MDEFYIDNHRTPVVVQHSRTTTGELRLRYGYPIIATIQQKPDGFYWNGKRYGTIKDVAKLALEQHLAELAASEPDNTGS